MKKLIVILFFMSMGAFTMAQSGPGVGASKRDQDKTMKDLREDVRAHEATKQVVGSDLTHFRIRQAFRDKKQVAETHRRVDADRRVAREQGIDHPIGRARRLNRAQDEHTATRHS